MNTTTDSSPSQQSVEKTIEDAGAARGFDPARGLPGAEILTRLANEMFSRLPSGAIGASVLTPETAAAASNAYPPQGLPAQIPVRGPLPADPLKSENLPLAGAPGVSSRFAPSAHGAPFTRPLPPSPAAAPFPGEAELRALLKRRIPSPATAPSFPGQALPAHPQPSSVSHGATEASPGSSYYFLDESRYPRATKATSQPLEPQPGYDVLSVRRDFPILDQRINGHPLIWLDNAATTQKPQTVIDRLVHFYSYENSNVHRGAHELAARSTDAYEDAREKVRGFLSASSSDEIVFVRGATEAINLVAQSFGRQNIGEGDEIVITWLEHHANIVPWQQLATETGAVLKVVPVDDRGQVLLDAYEKLLGPAHEARLVHRRCRTRWGRSRPPSKWSRWPIATGRWSSSMARRQSRTCPSTCKS